MILLIDHFDSFVFNLAHYFMELGQEVNVVRQDKISLNMIQALCPSHIVLSPGPGSPHEAQESIDVVKTLAGVIPILGVCLGHQIIGHVFGGEVRRAIKPMHGQASRLFHQQTGLFSGLPNPCFVGRYHSLIVDEKGLSESLRIIARSEENEIMAMVSEKWRLAGVQFHPESILTEGGHLLLHHFLEEAWL